MIPNGVLIHPTMVIRATSAWTPIRPCPQCVSLLPSKLNHGDNLQSLLNLYLVLWHIRLEHMNSAIQSKLKKKISKSP